MTGLAEFVAARLDKVEATARCALMWQQEGHAVFVAHYGAEWGAIDDYDPPRALREVEAKRGRLALMAKATAEMDAALADDTASRVDQAMAVGYAIAATVAVKHDAAIWRDHPDYDQGWAP